MTKIKLSISGPHKQVSKENYESSVKPRINLILVSKYLKQLLTNNVIHSP